MFIFCNLPKVTQVESIRAGIWNEFSPTPKTISWHYSASLKMKQGKSFINKTLLRNLSMSLGQNMLENKIQFPSRSHYQFTIEGKLEERLQTKLSSDKKNSLQTCGCGSNSHLVNCQANLIFFLPRFCFFEIDVNFISGKKKKNCHSIVWSPMFVYLFN